ncbi:MAG TPA: TolC family protein [Bryobacteraceae bacterium]|nr:TolC family protein [Bryobacteraceae bacterium]
MSRVTHRKLLAPGLWLLAAVAASAAEAPLFPRFNWFRQHLGSPTTHVELQTPAHISNHVVDGRLELSLRSFIELALENNTDIALAKLQVLFPVNSIMRAFSAFDPALQASFSSTRSTQPTTSALSGAATLKYLSQPVDFSFQQMVASGTTLSVSFDANRNSSNSSFSTYNPALSSSLSVSFDQPLLRGRGASIAKTSILIARSNLKYSHYQLRDQVSSLISAAENVYWDVVEARENMALQSKFLALREAALDRAQKQVDAGALLPLDIFQPKAEYASAQVAMIQAKQTLAHRENALRQQMGADLDPQLRALPIVLTEPFAIAPMALPDRETAVRKALASRADHLAIATSLETDDLNIRNATEAMRPSLSLTGNYISQGVGGIYHQISNPFGQGTVVTQLAGGLGDALSQMFGFGFPVYSLGLRLRLPLRDRSSAADLADAEVRKRQDALQLRKLEQGLRLQVLNAVDDLEAVQASMKQSEVAREFAEKRFAAEQKKYELGVTQLFFVLDSQTQLNQAENDVLRQSITYRRSLINLYLMTGELLAERGITVD